MFDKHPASGYAACRDTLLRRSKEPVPGRLQLLTGPRQVGKTTLLLERVGKLGEAAMYAAGDDPGAALPGFWERIWQAAEARAERGTAYLFLDEVQYIAFWSRRLKGQWDRVRRTSLPLHVVATGSSALHLRRESRESLAGRFERQTLGHWSAASLAESFGVSPGEAAEAFVRIRAYPGAFPLRDDPPRWRAYVRDAGALETIAHYLTLLRDAHLVAALEKFSTRAHRRRSAPPKLVPLDNALMSALHSEGPPDPAKDPGRFGVWVENACLASAWNSGHRVAYWREEPLEVDGVIEGPGGGGRSR
jgi:hypothetical protein